MSFIIFKEFKNLSEIEGEFKLNFKRSYDNKIIKANGTMIVSDSKCYVDWYYKLFKNSTHSLIKKIAKNARMKSNYCFSK